MMLRKPTCLKQKIILFTLIWCLFDKSNQSVVIQDHNPQISLNPYDRVWYPVEDFVDLSRADTATFHSSGTSKIIEIESSIKRFKFPENIGEVRHFEMITENRLGLLSINGTYNEFKIMEDEVTLEFVGAIRLPESTKHDCFSILPPALNKMTYITCFEKKKKKISINVMQNENDLKRFKEINKNNEKQSKEKFEKGFEGLLLDDPVNRILQTKRTEGPASKKETNATNSTKLKKITLKRQVMKIFYFDTNLALINPEKHIKTFNITLEKSELEKGDIEFRFARFGPSESLRLIIYNIPFDLTEKSENSMIRLRQVWFDDAGEILGTNFLRYDINRKGLKNFRGLSYYNNDLLMFIAQDLFGDTKYFVEFSIDPIKNKLIINKKHKIRSRIKLENIFAQFNGKYLIFNRNKWYFKACHIISSGEYNGCVYFDMSLMKKRGNDMDIQRVTLRDNLLLLEIIENNRLGTIAVWGTKGQLAKHKKFPDYDRPGYIPLLLGSRLFLASSNEILTNIAVTPHIVINAGKSGGSTGKIEVLDSDFDDANPTNLDFKINVLSSLKNDITSIPTMYDVELLDDSPQFRVFEADNIIGNIKNVEIRRVGDISNEAQVDVQIKIMEEVDFHYDAEELAIDHHNIFTVKEKRRIQAHKNCVYEEFDSKFICDSSTNTKRLKHDSIIGAKFIDIDHSIIELKQAGKIIIAVSGEFIIGKSSRFIILTDSLELDENVIISGLVKTSTQQYAYIACSKTDCNVIIVQMSKEGFKLTPVGTIDEFFVKKSEFCPKSIVGFSDDNTFLIESNCQNTNKDLIRIRVEGKLIIYDSYMRIKDSSIDYKVCSSTIIALYKKSSSKINLRRYGVPEFAENNNIDVNEIGLSSVVSIHCKFNSFIITGPSDNKKKLKIAVLQTRMYLNTRYLDNKENMVRFVGEVDKFEDLTTFSDPNRYRSFIMLIFRRGNKHSLYAMLSQYGYLLEVRPKLNSTDLTTFEDNYEVEFKGFNDDSRIIEKFRVFYHRLENEFSAELISKSITLENKDYNLNDLFKISSKIISFYYDPYESTTAQIIGDIEPYTPKSNGEEISITRFSEVTSDRQFWISILGKKLLTIQFHWKDLPLFTYSEEKIKRVDVKIISMTHREDTNEFILVFTAFYHEDERLCLRVFDNKGGVVESQNFKFNTGADMIKLIVFKDDYYLMNAAFGYRPSQILNVVKLAKTIGKRSVARIATAEVSNIRVIQFLSNKDHNLAIFSDMQGKLLLKEFDITNGVFNANLLELTFKGLKLKILDIKCKEYSLEALNNAYVGHCIGITESRSHIYFNISNDLSKEPDFRVLTGIMEEGNSISHDWDLSDNFIAHRGDFVARVLGDKNKRHYSQEGIATWNINDNSTTPHRFWPYLPGNTVFLLITGENATYDYLITRPTENTGCGYFKLHSISQPTTLRVYNATGFRLLNRDLVLCGLSECKLTNFGDVFNITEATLKTPKKPSMKLKSASSTKQRSTTSERSKLISKEASGPSDQQEMKDHNSPKEGRQILKFEDKPDEEKVDSETKGEEFDVGKVDSDADDIMQTSGTLDGAPAENNTGDASKHALNIVGSLFVLFVLFLAALWIIVKWIPRKNQQYSSINNSKEMESSKVKEHDEEDMDI